MAKESILLSGAVNQCSIVNQTVLVFALSLAVTCDGQFVLMRVCLECETKSMVGAIYCHNIGVAI